MNTYVKGYLPETVAYASRVLLKESLDFIRNTERSGSVGRLSSQFVADSGFPLSSCLCGAHFQTNLTSSFTASHLLGLSHLPFYNTSATHSVPTSSFSLSEMVSLKHPSLGQSSPLSCLLSLTKPVLLTLNLFP